MKTLKPDQRGAFDHTFIILLVILVTFGGFVYTRVQNASKNADASLASAEKSSKLQQSDGSETKIVAFPGLEEVSEDELEDSSNTQNDTQEEAPDETVEADEPATELAFTKGGLGIDGLSVVASATLNEVVDGSCTFDFGLGNSSISKSSVLKGDKTCRIEVPISEFTKSGTWKSTISFAESSSSRTANSGTASFDLVPAEVIFNKGGVNFNYDTGSLNISSTTSFAQTGTCTYSLSKDGFADVEKTVDIQESRTCAVSIPASDFPDDGTWTMYMSFISSTDFATGQVGPVDAFVSFK